MVMLPYHYDDRSSIRHRISQLGSQLGALGRRCFESQLHEHLKMIGCLCALLHIDMFDCAFKAPIILLFFTHLLAHAAEHVHVSSD